jgi:hypothetical protein
MSFALVSAAAAQLRLHHEGREVGNAPDGAEAACLAEEKPGVECLVHGHLRYVQAEVVPRRDLAGERRRVLELVIETTRFTMPSL